MRCLESGCGKEALEGNNYCEQHLRSGGGFKFSNAYSLPRAGKKLPSETGKIRRSNPAKEPTDRGAKLSKKS
jgi:hypothetical protein